MLPKYLFQIAGGSIDAISGVIHGVSVITEGDAKGHGLLIDSTTLSQVKACAESYKGGVKVKMGHGSGVDAIVGRLNQFRIVGNKLLADLSLVKSHPDYSFLLELAQTIPDTFGISIAFTGEDEVIEGKAFARCIELYSADIVSEPAANASGLFEQPQPSVDKSNNVMTPEQLAALQASIQSSIETHFVKVNERLTALEVKPPEPTKAQEAPTKTEEEKKLELAEVIRSEARKLMLEAAVPPVATSPSAAIATAVPNKKFFELVSEKKATGISQGQAIDLCVKEFPDEYREYREKELGIKII